MSQLEDFEKSNIKIQSSEESLLSSSVVTRKRRRFWERLGKYNLMILVFGTVTIAASLGVLIFLWVGSILTHKTGRSPRNWKTMFEFLSGTRTVTISSVLIRFATSLHLGLFASMVAALILERAGVSLEDLPALSMIRHSNSGPNDLFKNVLHSITLRSHLGYCFLIILAILNATALQFTSTILLGDFGVVHVAFEPSDDVVPYGIRDRNTSDSTQGASVFQGVDYWNSALTSYPLFAEYAEPRAKGDNWVDTGKVYRGFLPLSDWKLSSVRKYDGPMTVFDARVVCVQPTLSNPNVDANATLLRPSISGNLNIGKTHPALSEYASDDPTTSRFNCSLPTQVDPIPSNYAAHHWALAICDLGDETATFSEGLWMNQTDSFSRNTWAWLVLNVTGNTTEWVNALPDSNSPLEQVQAPDSSWASVGHANLRVDVTLCVNDPSPLEYLLTVRKTNDIVSGASIHWNTTTGMYDTGLSRDLLGATKQEIPREKRSTYNLQVPSNWSAAEVPRTSTNRTMSWLWYAVVIGDESKETFPTYFLTNYGQGRGIYRTHIAIFQDIMHDTRNAALALQSLFTNLMATAYYDFLPEFDISGKATIEQLSSELLPVTLGYFCFVLILLGNHFSLIIITMYLFLTKTNSSMLGNAWQPILQLAVEDRVHSIPHGHSMTDREILKSVKPKDMPRGKIRIGRTYHDD